MISLEKIKKLREETGVSISECKKALEKAKGNLKQAKETLKKSGRDLAKEKKEREVKAGIIESYIHSGKKIGAMVELHCESDFVARSEDFQKLAHELCLQIAAISSEEIPLPKQPWIRDETKTVKDLIDEYIAKFGENIVLKNFVRYEL
jgi:elongation factor Ts